MPAYGDPTRTLTRSGITCADLGLADDASLASLAEDLIEQASDSVGLYCGRDFGLHEDVAERYDGTGRDRLMLRGRPIVSVASVEVDGVALTEGIEYEVHEGPGILERVDGTPWRRGRRNVVVTYSHGYTSPPGAIVGVVEDLVAGALTHAARNHATKGASSMSMDGYSVAYSELSRLMVLAPEQMQILDRYRAAGVG
ncbi:MAG: hypothetical protein PHU37_08730 [Methanoculleus chikugoensis]|nr:hypothetical protein [Methanoculleus chikugoensis]